MIRFRYLAFYLWLFIALACSNASQTVSTMSGVFAACARADLGAVVRPGVTLDVAQLIEGNAASLEGDLAALAVTFGLDAIDCAIEAVASVIGPIIAGARSPSTAEAGPEATGLARAKAWLAGQRQTAASARKAP